MENDEDVHADNRFQANSLHNSRQGLLQMNYNQGTSLRNNWAVLVPSLALSYLSLSS
jgi:hypothetical protein